MLYFFKIIDSPFFNFGSTEKEDPWDRIRNGFWTNSHPPELCQKLNPDSLKLIVLFKKSRRLERPMQSIFPPALGEYWKDEDLEDFVWLLKLISEEIPIPSRPCFHYTQHAEKLYCCTNILHTCFTCAMQFSRFCKLLQHKRVVRKFPRKGNLDRHVLKS